MENQILRFARTAMAVARRGVPDRLTRFAHPTYTPASLFAALLLRKHLRLTSRSLEDLLRIAPPLRRLFGFRIVPDHSTLWWFARRHLRAELLVEALRATVARVRGFPDRAHQIARDSTGLWLSCTSWYFAWRAKRDRGQRGWMKWALALSIEPQMLVAQHVRPGPCGDFSDLVPLATVANNLKPFNQVIADAGYDSEANHRFCRETLGVDSLIPAKRRRSVAILATTPYRQEMVRRLGDPGEASDRTAYRQRWKAETIMSVVKRRCGEALTARLEPTQRGQALLRGVAYNIQRLVRLGLAA